MNPPHPWPPPPPLPGEPVRVFCHSCRHRSREWHSTGMGRVFSVPGEHCGTKPRHVLDPINGLTSKRVPCRERNAQLDCGLFEPKERTEYSAWKDPVMWAGGIGMVLCVAAGLAMMVALVLVAFR